jgi:hypothetical protein
MRIKSSSAAAASPSATFGCLADQNGISGHIGYLFRQLSRATGSPISPSHSASCRRTSRVLRTSGRTRDRSSQTSGRPPAVRVR